jgi:hypothetical protein
MPTGSSIEASWNILQWFQVLGLGSVAGAIGQGIRMIVGMKKVNDTANGSSSAVSDPI